MFGKLINAREEEGGGGVICYLQLRIVIPIQRGVGW